MKTGANLFAPRCAAVGVALCAASAVHALPATSETQIVNPVSVTNGSDLDFGRFIAGGVNSRVIVPATSDTVIVSSGTAIPASGTVSRARFDVVAPPLTLVFISLPTSIQLTRVSGTELMLLDQFQQNGAATRIMGLSGQFSFYVGGRLRIGPAQTQGRYQGTFNVTVNFL